MVVAVYDSYTGERNDYLLYQTHKNRAHQRMIITYKDFVSAEISVFGTLWGYRQCQYVAQRSHHVQNGLN